jgi:fumarate reductase subunit C
MPVDLALATLRAFLVREEGDALSQVMWSLGFVLLVGAICIVLGPKVGADWREFVGRPTP